MKVYRKKKNQSRALPHGW